VHAVGEKKMLVNLLNQIFLRIFLVENTITFNGNWEDYHLIKFFLNQKLIFAMTVKNHNCQLL
jgi:hypothetical protein